jgi:hypothetical protein
MNRLGGRPTFQFAGRCVEASVLAGLIQFAPTRLQFEPKRLGRSGSLCRLFQLGLHGRLSTALSMKITAASSETQVTFRRPARPPDDAIGSFLDSRLGRGIMNPTVLKHWPGMRCTKRDDDAIRLARELQSWLVTKAGAQQQHSAQAEARLCARLPVPGSSVNGKSAKPRFRENAARRIG